MKAGIPIKMKHLALIALACILLSCGKEKYTTLSGKTMGTYYSIQYSSGQNFSNEINSVLNDFINAASTYDDRSELSEFNRAGKLNFRSSYLYEMLLQAKEIHQLTSGSFEPTLMPLIRAYGFSTSKRVPLSSTEIDSLLDFVSFNYIAFDKREMKSLKAGVQLDLNAIGEGFAIELISQFLETKGIASYKVEIGGEMKCKGKNPKNEDWLIGIENPVTRKPLTTLRLKDAAISTSGISRKFYIDENGDRQSHIINPKTGRPIHNNLVSVTVRHKKASMADGLATAMMVMGLDSAQAFAENLNIDTFIIFEENGKVRSWSSPNFFNAKD